MPTEGDIVKFDVSKNFKLIRKLGCGGTGDTYLLQDEAMDEYFAVKKYNSKEPEFEDEYYQRFVDEIKILLTLSHTNIVRIYNYYLYPLAKTGYLQMEYIEGKTIDRFESCPWDMTWEDVFNQTLLAFRYLEQKNILHRDIRKTNIMINTNNEVKIIDFGFGKVLGIDKNYANSIFLNWSAPRLPEEIDENNEYSRQSEIYFLGHLFNNLILKDLGSLQLFEYEYVIEKMIKFSPVERYKSFEEISLDISEGKFLSIDFDDEEKEIYQIFANELCGHINHFIDKYVPYNNVSTTISRLEELIKVSALENNIQDNKLLINAFVSNGYNFNSSTDIRTYVIKRFYKFIASLNPIKQQVVFDNLNVRLSKIKIKKSESDFSEDDVPF